MSDAPSERGSTIPRPALADGRKTHAEVQSGGFDSPVWGGRHRHGGGDGRPAGERPSATAPRRPHADHGHRQPTHSPTTWPACSTDAPWRTGPGLPAADVRVEAAGPPARRPGNERTHRCRRQPDLPDLGLCRIRGPPPHQSRLDHHPADRRPRRRLHRRSITLVALAFLFGIPSPAPNPHRRPPSPQTTPPATLPSAAVTPNPTASQPSSPPS